MQQSVPNDVIEAAVNRAVAAALAQQGNPVKRGISFPEFTTTYGIHKTKICALINSGALDIKKVGRRTLITTESAEAWWASLPGKQQEAA